MSSKSCSSCGGTDIEVDRGVAVCTSCGVVLEENCIVSEVQFEENAYGGASALGQFVSSDAQGGTGFINSYRGGGGKASREITLRKARDRISIMGQQLNLNTHCVDMACNFYNMALSRRLTNGRKSAHVVAACIYITCRMEGTAHLLIDIADVIDINVYTLGHTFLQIAKAFNLTIPSVDPCLYVMRYANRMGFGDKTQDVSKTALRLVQRMKRDWIHTGRRPSGLCGAALLIAARHHGFSRTVSDVIKEVKVHENTVRKRMQEFGETPSSSLTLDEFMQVDLEEEHDPPAFLKSRKKDRGEKADEVETEGMLELEKEIDRQIAERLAKKRGPWAKYAKETLGGLGAVTSSSGSSETAGRSGSPDVNEVIADVTLSAVKECLTPSEAAVVDKASTSRSTDESILMPPPDATYLQLRQHLRPSLASLGIFAPSEKDETPQTEATPVDESGELDMEGLSDTEIDGYIKSPEEVKITSEMWMEINGEFMKELEAKQKRKAEEEQEKIRRGEKRKRKVTRRQQPSYAANTPGEAIGKMLVGKKISNKIDYDKLKDLGFIFGGVPSSSSSAATTSTAGSSVLSSEPIIETAEDAAAAKRPKRGATAAKTESKEKKPKTVAPVAPVTPALPSVPQPHDYEEEEEEEEEEEGIQSAASLLNNFHGDGGYGGEDYDY